MRITYTAVALVAALAAAGCAQMPPLAFDRTRVLHTVHDGIGDDLLTAGLGRSGLALAQPPAVADPRNPTRAELRRRAIHANYRALFDMTAAGGFGVLYGPNIDLAGNDTLGEGRIAGDEFLTVLDGGDGRDNVVLMVQVPATFSPAQPCIVAAPSSGSRGIYGAISVVGEWGLKRGCAVAYTDKGTGTGWHDLDTDSVNLVTGERATAERAGRDSHFTAALTAAERARFVQQYPHRIAVKHAHSQRNPERDWGRHTLAAVEFAFHVLNGLRDARAGQYTPHNTLVIAAGVSNGGYASLLAAEQDERGLIDGVAVSMPNVSLAGHAVPAIQQGARRFEGNGRSLLDYITLKNLYVPCASLAAAQAQAPLNTVPRPLREARCAELTRRGLLQGADLEAQATHAQRILDDAGILPEAGPLLPAHYTLNVFQSVAVLYAKSYGRFAVTDHLCGFSYAATVAQGEDAGRPTAATGLELSFAASSGIPPTAGVSIVNNLSRGGAREDRASVTASSGARDMNLDGALCLRALATGVDPVSGQPLTGELAAQHRRVAAGIAQTRMSGQLRGKPTAIVNGRADALLPPNHAARAYVAFNRAVDPAARVHYWEVTHAQHLDALNAVAGFDSRFLPLHVYYVQALNLMWDHLRHGRPLPPSQLVRTTPRAVVEGRTAAITPANVPRIEQALGPNTLISVGLDGTLRIPQ